MLWISSSDPPLVEKMNLWSAIWSSKKGSPIPPSLLWLNSVWSVAAAKYYLSINYISIYIFYYCNKTKQWEWKWIFQYSISQQDVLSNFWINYTHSCLLHTQWDFSFPSNIIFHLRAVWNILHSWHQKDIPEPKIYESFVKRNYRVSFLGGLNICVDFDSRN